MYQYLVSSEVVPTSGKNLEEYENGGLIDRSAKCDLLVSAEDGKEMPDQCNFCLKTDTDINRGNEKSQVRQCLGICLADS